MKKTSLLSVITTLLALSALSTWAQSGLLNGARGVPYANDGTTGTTLYGTAKVTASGAAINAGTADIAVATYPVIGGAGTTGNAVLATVGIAPCTMDATLSSAAGDYVVNSATVAHECHAQSSAPASGTYVIGWLHDASTTSGQTALVEVSPFVVGGGSGTVTSVGLSLPSFFSVSGSPVTTSGTLAGGYATGLTANENYLLGVNASGAAGLYALNSFPAAAFPVLNQNTTGNAATATNLASYPGVCSSGQFSQGLSSGSNNCATPSGSLPSGVNGQALINNGTGATSYTAESPTLAIGNGGAAVSLASANYSILCDSATVATGIQDRGKVIVVGTGGSNDVVIPDLSGTGCSGMYGAIVNSTSPTATITVSRQTSDTFNVYGPTQGAPTTGATTFTLAAGQRAVYRPSVTAAQYDVFVYFAAGASGTAGGDLSGTYPNPTVVKVNGGAVPTSAHVLGSNSSGQLITSTRSDIDAITYAAGGGTAQAQTVTLAPAITAYAAGLTVRWKPTAANTAPAPTLAVNGLAAITIVKEPGNAALVANDLTTSAIAVAVYDGTDFELQNPQTSASGAGTGTCTNQAVTAVNSGAAPTCTTVTSAYVDSSVVTDAGNTTTTANKVAQSTTTAGKIAFNDFPYVVQVQAANCNNATAGAGWSLPTSSAPTPVCRTGTNVQRGYLQYTADAQSAQFVVGIPSDYDSGGTVYARIHLTQGANTTSGQTIIMSLATGCSSTTDDPAFNAAQNFGTATTGTTANTPYDETLSSVTMTGCSAGHTLVGKIARATDTATTAPNIDYVLIEFPTLPTMGTP